MPSSYQKVIRTSQTPTGQKACLYVVVKDSRPIEFYITVSRKRVAAYHSRDPATQRFASFIAGDEAEAAPPRLDDFTTAAQELETNPSKSTPFARFALLAELERRASGRRGTTPKHANIPSFLATLLPNDVIPSDESGFVRWLENALRSVTDGITTVSALKVRTGTFARCLSQLSVYPLAFRNYQRAYSLAKSRLDRQRQEQNKSGRPQENRRPFSRTEILALLQSCSSINQSLLILCYLALGTRSGDAENASLKHLVNGRYELEHIQSKTRTDKKPIAPFMLKVLLRYLNDVQQHFESIDIIADKLRFRPTTGVMLTLAGVDALTTSIRLGHVGMGMIVRHYVRFMPPDYGENASAWDYYGVEKVKVAGIPTNENAYDNWLLFLLFNEANRFGKLERIRTIALDELKPKDVTLKSASF